MALCGGIYLATGDVDFCYTLPPDPHWSLRVVEVADGSDPHPMFSDEINDELDISYDLSMSGRLDGGKPGLQM